MRQGYESLALNFAALHFVCTLLVQCALKGPGDFTIHHPTRPWPLSKRPFSTPQHHVAAAMPRHPLYQDRRTPSEMVSRGTYFMLNAATNIRASIPP